MLTITFCIALSWLSFTAITCALLPMAANTTDFSAALRGRNGEPAPASPPNPAGAGTLFSGNHR